MQRKGSGTVSQRMGQVNYTLNNNRILSGGQRDGPEIFEREGSTHTMLRAMEYHGVFGVCGT